MKNTIEKPLNFVGKGKDIVSGYLTGCKNWNAEANRIHRDYAGEKQREKNEAHAKNKPSSADAIAKLQALETQYTDFLDGLEAEALNPKNVSPDFELLRLPITLSVAELQKLHARNCDNPLFCRGLKQYFSDHKDNYPAFEFIDFRDSVEARRDVVKYFIKECLNEIRHNDIEQHAITEQLGWYDGIEQQLNGEGLFRQPVVREPQEGEEAAGGAPPAPRDAFLEGFGGSIGETH